jgi:8-oxo-dGTP pyrophosphatase MutT (NUDIX family)
MKIEVSAGGVVYRKKGKHFKVLLLKDKNGQWTFPKGLIEKGENKSVTAQREIREEVGLSKTKLIDSLSSIGYWYRWQNQIIKKTVYYFLFISLGDEKIEAQQEEGITEVKWFSPEEALKIVGYRKTNIKILEQAIGKAFLSHE